MNYRLHIHKYMSRVSGNCQKSYTTFGEASEIYRNLKANGLVRIIREPGDENFFGPLDEAIQ